MNTAKSLHRCVSLPCDPTVCISKLSHSTLPPAFQTLIPTDHRVLEPLICLTFSNDEQERAVVLGHMQELIWLVKYPNVRVQFQSLWSLQNIALWTDEARILIHKSGGTRCIFENFHTFDVPVQLEAAAVVANLAMCKALHRDMVHKYKAIEFFITHIGSRNPRLSQFASTGLGNLAVTESNRSLIRKSMGVQALFGNIVSPDYLKRKYALSALANVALSQANEIIQIFHSKSLVDRVMRIALKRETDTEREAAILLRNMSAHAALHLLLDERGIDRVVQVRQKES